MGIDKWTQLIGPREKFHNFEEYVKNKVVGVDTSVLFHGLLGKGGKCSSEVRKLLAVNPQTSVYYVVAQMMNLWFINHSLHRAKAVIFVHDPKLVGQYHCDACKTMCEKHDCRKTVYEY